MILVSVNSISCQIDQYALYHPPAQVNLTLVGQAMPTEASLILNWGDVGSTDLYVSMIYS